MFRPGKTASAVTRARRTVGHGGFWGRMGFRFVGMQANWRHAVTARGWARALGAACVLAATPAQAQSAPGAAAAGQLTLAAAKEILAQSNRQIRLARRGVDVATAEIRRVDVRPNPTVSAEVYNSVARQYSPAYYDSTVRLEQLFERGGKRELRAGVARKGELAARMGLADVTRQQRAALADAYFELVATQRLVEIADENLAGSRRLLEAGELRLKAGDIAQVDVARLRVEANRTANEARMARQALGQAQIGLATVLGIESEAAGLKALDDLPPLDSAAEGSREPAASNAKIEQALERRADAVAARARVDALSTASALAQSLRTRDVTLGVHAEHAQSYGGTVFGVSASIPLMVNNDFSGDVARAQAELEQAREDLERIRGAIRADIALSSVQLSSAQDRARRTNDTALPEARRAAEAIEFAFRRGAASLTDLFDARRQFAAVRAEAIGAHAEFAKALAAYRESIATEETP